MNAPATDPQAKPTPAAEDGIVQLALSGNVDLEHAPAIRDQLLAAIGAAPVLLVDLSAVTYIDSSGIANLVEALQKANENGHRLGLVALSEQASRVFELARLDKVFAIFPDHAAAVAATVP